MQENRCLLRLTEFSRAGVDLIDRLVQFIKPGCLPLIHFFSREFKETLMEKGSFHHQIHKSQSIPVRLQFSASNLQTLDRNFLSPATLNISWKRFATVKALNAENDSVIPFTATVFAHGASNLWALIIDARAVFCSVAYELSSIFFTRTGSWDSCSQWKLFSCYNKGHFHIFPFA
ncbi:hypothetical protein HanXRQr2_Chr01g0000641 [Helianthus annuus]|uniref:Uncharacterized protein n=1 Tax=Helianthus annuus TaxID=4232 RepID=A0A9K3JTE1_HELAN|nr:hypothetical protein HanXRQr2_Chr01g0000641 [Helianthus annuus]KAJ0610139.1 hypothetical protein HanHA300_Chr01g0000541 [Helianthus annuus]KAJ0625344.1 hypothetical protein HanHA89_Chr01g0000601 [Helianthus annuus]KAJ0781762.1 hypothetical protein HanLR1_Chr01g0000511 [Helianthus annuus]